MKWLSKTRYMILAIVAAISLFVGAAVGAAGSNLVAVMAKPAVAAQTAAPSGDISTTATADANSAVEQVVNKANPAVVTIVSGNAMASNSAPSTGPNQQNPGRRSPLMPGQLPFGNQTQVAVGSGIIIDSQGDILTNNHVVGGQQQFMVIFANGDTAQAKFVAGDSVGDVAVIKVDGKVPATAVLGDSSKLQLGQEVVAIGSALGDYRNTVTTGVISGLNRQLQSMEGLIQTDAPINPGNSGGPLLNLTGEVVGINTAVLRQDGNTGDVVEGLGFAIPINTAKAIANQLMASGSVSRPFLGVSYETVTPELAAVDNLPVKNGALIMAVQPGSPADQAKLAQNDVITAVDGQTIDENNTFSQLLMPHRPGDKVTLTVMRSGNELKVQVLLTTRTNQ